jgi:hypothetical protein
VTGVAVSEATEPEVLDPPSGTVLRRRGADGPPVGASGADCSLSITRLRRLVAAA